MLVKKLKKVISDPYYVVGKWMFRNHPKWMCDKWYLKVMWKREMGDELNLKQPKSYNEKLQWLKLYDRRPEYTLLVDKYRVKQWVADRIGDEHIVPTLAVWTSIEEIDINALPDRFVIKCNHDSGSVIICRDKSTFDLNAAKTKLGRAMAENFYWPAREWPYKNVARRIIAEQYMEDEYGELRDYKWFCFDGKVKALFVATDRNKGEQAIRFDFYDEYYNHLPFINGHPNADIPPVKPKMFDQMKEFAAKLSKGIPHVRVDFYEINNHVYFGEMTFFHWSGFMPFEPAEWDYKFGSWIRLPIDV